MVAPTAGAVVLVRFPANQDLIFSDVAILKAQSLKQVVDAVVDPLRAGNVS